MTREIRRKAEVGDLFPVIHEERRHPEDPGFFIDEEYNVFYGPFIVAKIPKRYQSQSGTIFKPELITAIRLVGEGVMRVVEYEYNFIPNSVEPQS